MYLKTGCTSLSFTTYLSLTCAHVTSLRAKAWISKWTEVSSRANFTATKQQHSPQFLDFNGFQRYCITHTHRDLSLSLGWSMNFCWITQQMPPVQKWTSRKTLRLQHSERLLPVWSWTNYDINCDIHEYKWQTTDATADTVTFWIPRLQRVERVRTFLEDRFGTLKVEVFWSVPSKW